MATLSSLMPMIRMMSISKVPWLGSYVTISTWVRLTIILFRGKPSSKCNKGEETEKTCEQCKRDAGVQRSMGVMEQDKRRRTEKQSSRRTAQEKESVEKQEN